MKKKLAELFLNLASRLLGTAPSVAYRESDINLRPGAREVFQQLRRLAVNAELYSRLLPESFDYFRGRKEAFIEASNLVAEKGYL